MIVIEDIGAVMNEMEMDGSEDREEGSGESDSHSLLSHEFEVMV